MLRTWTCIENLFAIGSCFEIIHFPSLIGGIIHQFDLNSWILIWTFIHNACQFFIFFLNETFGAKFKLINALLLLVWWVTIFIKVRMITANALWKVPSDAINASTDVTTLAVMCVIHCVILSPEIFFIPGWWSCIVKLVFSISNTSSNLCICTT